MTEADTQTPAQIFIGGYTAEMGGGSSGLISLSGSDPATELGAVGLQSPTYLIKHPSEPWLYAVSESTPGMVSALRYD